MPRGGVDSTMRRKAPCRMPRGESMIRQRSKRAGARGARIGTGSLPARIGTGSLPGGIEIFEGMW